MRARPGNLYVCPCCAYPRYVPLDRNNTYVCAMPKIELPSGKYAKCTFRTTAAAWARWPRASAAYEAACKTVVKDVPVAVEAQEVAGDIEPNRFWPEVRRQMVERTTALQIPPPPAPPAAAAGQPPAGAAEIH